MEFKWKMTPVSFAKGDVVM